MYDEENAHTAHEDEGSHVTKTPAGVDKTRSIIEEINGTLLKAFRLAIKSHNENYGPFCLINDSVFKPVSSLSADDPFNAGFSTGVCFEEHHGRRRNKMLHRLRVTGTLTGKLAEAFAIVAHNPQFSMSVDADSEQDDTQYCYDLQSINRANVEMLYSVNSEADLSALLANVKQVWREVCEAYVDKP